MPSFDVFLMACDSPFLGTSQGESSGQKVIIILVTISLRQSANSKQNAKYSKKYPVLQILLGVCHSILEYS